MKGLLTSLQTWWLSISQREQRLVVVCAVLVALGSIYWGVVQPVLQRADNAQMRIQSERQLLSWVKNKADEISELKAQGGVAVSSMPINQAVSSSVKRFNVELIRMQPRGEQFQVWVEPMPFNQFVSWIAYLQDSYGIEVVFLDIDKGDQDGLIEVNRLQLSRG
ncbi:type II secretion system protein M [Vibrio brasiliensis]|uniref:Type II secretion system protein M n=1 Tax=Vibrio brasiliensis LMG 20546 TaxID=945543 RepID=E8LY88_9VIBR|nr:type II secretion system protein M [Vibrio brasiliensis]EGA64339.1 type II secretory pathway, component EpsM [Vibrio brasiliensis LMG 20546]MCG9650393.1 type II secretion system protein M [Vibrio brasiliensis]MCG9723721.1 type II secretion system protein M [Vibrio brasiliensis]MCG9750441.1 type II secretion system protein M [Vibrio brasiliensis]MCG9783305.1 type II secretion system protein M [Vibrio brasiliensis]